MVDKEEIQKKLTGDMLRLLENETIQLGGLVEFMERSMYEAAMTYTRGNQIQAAKVLGVARTTLREKLKYYFRTTHVGGLYHQPTNRFSCGGKN